MKKKRLELAVLVTFLGAGVAVFPGSNVYAAEVNEIYNADIDPYFENDMELYCQYVESHELSDYLDGRDGIFGDISFSDIFAEKVKVADFDGDNRVEVWVTGPAAAANNIAGILDISNGEVSCVFNGWGSEVRLKQHRIIPEEYRLKSVTVSQTPSGKYYASILFEYEDQVQEREMQKFLGMDFSMHELYRDSNGKEPAYPKYYRNAEKKLAREQRRLSKMQKGSSNRNKQRIKVTKLHEKVSNQRKDFLHKQSRQIANAYDCVCIEDLDMKAMSQSLNFGKSVSDNGWGMFTTFLKYKLEEQGKKLVRVDRFFASSQTCSVCGYKNAKTKNLALREWDCPQCGTHHDRDVNAAINIRNEGMRLVIA